MIVQIHSVRFGEKWVRKDHEEFRESIYHMDKRTGSDFDRIGLKVKVKYLVNFFRVTGSEM